MPQFAYTASNTSGQRSTGILVADDRKAAVEMLLQRDLLVTAIRDVGGSAGLLARLGLGTGRVSEEGVITFTRQLASMVAAGVPIQMALSILREEAGDAGMQTLLTELAVYVNRGESLTEAMARRRDTFSRQYLAMVAAGESSGRLESILQRLAQTLERAHELKRKVQSSLMYPGMVISFAVLVVGGILTFGIPRFAEIYSGFGRALPFATQVLLSIGNFLGACWPGLLGGFLLALVALKQYTATERGRWQRDAILLRLPALGPLMQQLAIANFARTLATLYGAGVPVLESLGLVGEGSNNAVIERVVKDCVAEVGAGTPLVVPLRRSGWFTPISLGMMTAGEHTGKLEDMLTALASHYETQVEITLRGLISLLEPAIMIGVGICIGAIVVAMILPIFQLANLFM